MRLTRLVIGFLLILGAVLVILGEQLSGASADAVINARLTTIRAPIAGTLSVERRPLGTRVQDGEELGSIQDPIVDDIRLNDLIRERAFAAAEVERLSTLVRAVSGMVEGLRLRSHSFRQERVRQLQAQLSSAHSQVSAAEARAEEARSSLQRSQQLSDQGLETSAVFGRNQSSLRVAELALEDARQRAAVAEISLQAARRGTFLGDGYNDVPFSEQEISELSLRVADLRSSLAAEEARVAALDARIASERLRVNRLTSAQLVSNVQGSVWEVLAGSGETVQRGQDLMRLVDCRSTIVTLSVTESVYNGLKIGDPATLRVGTDGRTFEGTVTRLAGSGAETIYRNLAIAPSAKHLERYDVTLLSQALRSSDLACAIGRTGRVFFDARPLDFLRRIWS